MTRYASWTMVALVASSLVCIWRSGESDAVALAIAAVDAALGAFGIALLLPDQLRRKASIRPLRRS